nr:uncharacterized protein LOC100183806 [Ciona intestinalis]|eukprot:XP_026693424.1 uncharacterized protein LOC100183806 [Ciona intestinalis]
MWDLGAHGIPPPQLCFNIACYTVPDAVVVHGEYEFTFYNPINANDRLNFDEANQVCMAGGGRLADIKSSDVQDMITNQLGGLDLHEDGWGGWDRGYWVGGKCEGGISDWVWGDGTGISVNGSSNENWYHDCGRYEPLHSHPTSRVILYGFDSYGSCTNVLGTWGGTHDNYYKKNWICMKDIDDCASTPCLNGGTCTDGVSSFTCACVNGYTGADCSTNIDDCASTPCANGGTCTDGVASFTCACVNGYTGADCSTNIDDCASTPCLNGGTCTDGVSSFTCACVNGYTGADCSTNIDDCASTPCPNGGTCSDGVASFTCACVNGYTGADCSTNIDDCASMPCLNGGTCTDGVASFTCACVNGYTGADCSTNIDDCASMPCLNGGTCTDGVASFTCACVNGYTGADCSTNIDDCASTPCLNGGTCTDGVASFTCACVNGYIGDICEADLCKPNPCNHGTCNHAPTGYRCICQDGYVGDHCETDLCEPNPCNNSGSCVRAVESFTCDCQPAFTGQLCAEAKFEENDLNENLFHINYQASSLSSFSRSSDLCELNKQAGLVIIKDLQTQQVIENQTSSMYNGEEVQLWIGAKKTSDGWFWLDGSHMTFQYWSETGSDVIGSCLKMVSQSGSQELRWLPGDCDETMGYICEQPVNLVDPCEVIECYNSGTCTSSGAHYHCQCVEGYEGEDCATKISDSSSTQLTIIIALSCVIGFLLLVVIATVLYFVRRQPVVDKTVGQHRNKAFKDDVLYEYIEDVYVSYNIEKNKLLERFEELSSNFNFGFMAQFVDMPKKADFKKNVGPNKIFKIMSETLEGAYVNEGNPQVFIASRVDCLKLWESIMMQQCRVIVGFPEKNEKFYPGVRLIATYGSIKVLTVEKKCFKYFSIVEIEASNQTSEYESVSRKIKLFQFNNWSDCDIINSRFVWFSNKVLESLSKLPDRSSVIVYGSDSATSLFVAYQQLTRCLKRENQINIFQHVVQLRKLNAAFFANLELYILLHQLLVEQHHLGNTDLHLADSQEESKSTRIQREFDFLQKTVKHEVHASVTLTGGCGPTTVCLTPVEKVENFWTKVFVENPDLIISCDKTKSLKDFGLAGKLKQILGETSLEWKPDANLIKIRKNNTTRTVAITFLETMRSAEDLIQISNIFRQSFENLSRVVVVTSWESVTMVALSQLIERIESESKFDIFRIVRDLKLFITMEQYELLYKCLLHHNHEANLYANSIC